MVEASVGTMDPRRALSFGSAAAEYDAARPSYPADAVRWAIGGARRVLDLGAGTGKLTSVLQALGIDTIAVEPDDAMRALVPGPAVAGTAEAIPLPDASVDAIVVGQAFHWFDAALAMPEMVRVLRPGGTVGMFWNMFDDAVPWVTAFCDTWDPEARASLFAHDATTPFDGPSFGLTVAERRLVSHEQPNDRTLLATQLRSISHFILLADDEREALVARAIAAAPSGRFTVPYVTDVWRATKA
ncbi:MAG: class SAM-dependent methyltransferase [Frankiales bacterium]|nr:class SAM-dependent methyltransferase [Frankiales bacterium]